MQFRKPNGIGNSQDLIMFLSGDFCPAKAPIDKLAKKGNEKNIFGDLLEIIRNADLSITNLECPLTLSNNAIEKIGPNLKAHPHIAALLRDAGFDMVTLANNHIYDFGQQGLFDTLESLKKNELTYVGAGLDLREAQKTKFIEIKGIRLAIINIAEIEFSCADAEHGGANPMELIDNFQQIKSAKRKADHVVLIVHGGHENYHYPSPKRLKRYRFFAESGASVIIGHHTHCINGYEQHNGVPIFYSLGNFFFPWTFKHVPQSWHEGYAILLKVSKQSLLFEVIPYEQCKNGSLTIERNHNDEIKKNIVKINNVLTNDRQIEENWRKFINEKAFLYLIKISGFGRFRSGILRRLGLLNLFYRKSQLNNVLQMIRCQAHREAAEDIVSEYFKKRGMQ